MVSLTGCRILSVDDCPAHGRNLASAFRRLGVELTVVETGAAAIAAVNEEPYDLILMDIGLPDMDGFEAAVHIRRIETARARAPVPIVALTAYPFSFGADIWRDAAISDVLEKPFTLHSLRACLTRWTGRSLASPDDMPRADTDPDVGAGSSGTAAARILELIDSRVLDDIRGISPPEDKLLARVVALYLEHAPKYVQRLRRAAAPAGRPAMAEAAHVFKSLSGNTGMGGADDPPGSIERGARLGTPVGPQVLEALEALEADRRPTLDALAVLVSEELRPCPAAAPVKRPAAVDEA